MRFDSAEFLLFFVVLFTCHQFLPRTRALLTFASYVFYASWNPPFLLLLLASTALDYAIGRRLENTRNLGARRMLLAASIAGNIGVLVYFKYVNFFLDTIASLLPLDHGTLQLFYVDVQIPLGISFYTFQTISYTVDVYRRQIRACTSFQEFALFVAFFPQLIAGPIVRAAELIPQIRNNPKADARQILTGVELCLVGLFKKVVLADNFALLVDQCFANPASYSGGAMLAAAFAFWFQIYFDFSGYSTMARGLAQLLGYHLPRNFLFPLLAANPVDYRRGWHVTMGNWFRDYLYRPLGGDRRGTVRTVINTMLTWTAFGLWHGASWSFLLWGFYNGLLLTAYRLLKTWNLLPGDHVVFKIGGYMVMPVLICISTICFRSPDVATTGMILGRILTWAPAPQSVNPAWVIGLLTVYACHWASKLWYREGLLSRVGWMARFVLIGSMMMLLFLFAGSGEPFYYFQF